MDQHVPRHEFVEGESFDYLYEASEATFATEQARDGRVPRITDLVKIDESRTTLRFTVVRDGEQLRKRVDFSGMAFREITADDLGRRERHSFRPGSEVVPGLPDVVTHVYDLGTDGRVASDLYVVFGDYIRDSGNHHPLRFIDAFTFAATLENVPKSMVPGDVRVRPSNDVTFYGSTYHSNGSILYFDRVETIDGLDHAFVKVQSPGNYTSNRGDDGDWLASALVPLDGHAAGLVARGELQELVYMSHEDRVDAIQRQVSFTMQTDRTQSLVDTL